jgi:biotin synthase-related radical SAM superfamily protein
MKCEHNAKGSVWAKIPEGTMKLHPVCGNCGTLKNVSSSKGKKLGYYLKVLSELRKMYKISEAQLRLIVRELESNEDFCDLWWVSYEQQKKIFISVVRKYVNVTTQILESLL